MARHQKQRIKEIHIDSLESNSEQSPAKLGDFFVLLYDIAETIDTQKDLDNSLKTVVEKLLNK